jgi:glycosyltransferase involved in cell wall biosynthesis
MNARAVDLLYLACNRLEFTRETFTALLAHTDWQYVNQLFIYDDGSQDGTREWLEQHAREVPVRTRLALTHFGSPVSAMVHFIETASAPILAKTDNDAMLPPSWLRASLDVLERHPDLGMLGIEAIYPHDPDVRLARSYSPAPFISGLGLYRASAFAGSRPTMFDRWYGFEAWQTARGADLTCGWITPALPVFLLDRLPCAPWDAYTDRYVRRGWQRNWPKYDPSSTLWEWHLGRATPREMSAPRDSRVLGAMRVKNEAVHLREVLARMLPLCARVLVFDDHSTDETAAVCASFGDRVTVFPSPFDGLDESRDKNHLLAKVVDARPEWVLWIDGDEVLERSGPEKLRLAAEAGGVAAYSLPISYLWGDPHHVRVDGIYGSFVRPSFFSLKGQPVHRLQFPSTRQGPNFHCGNVPQGLIGATHPLDVRLKHYGYMTRAHRLAKYEWYNALDPNNSAEDNYRHLAELPGARHAPGPPRLVPWTE